MFSNVALDVFIGLMSIYLLCSLFASVIMEWIAKILCLRQKVTFKAVSKLLEDSDYTNEGAASRMLSDFKALSNMSLLRDKKITALFYAHPNIKNIGRNNFSRKPSAITPEMFSETFIQILRGETFDGQLNQIELIKKNLCLGTPNEGVLPLPSWYKDKSRYKPLITQDDFIEIDSLTLYQIKQFLYDSHSDIDAFRTKIMFWFNEMMDRFRGVVY